MSVVGLDHVQVAAPRGCETEARRFYGSLLGLVEVEKPESLRGRGGVWFRCGEQQLHIGELDVLAESLQDAGEQVLWDEALTGIRRFYTQDPWGNRIELLE
jgi:catechol 2,3-dioxygenase-like lactoylglutathione lyase family enzyme